MGISYNEMEKLRAKNLELTRQANHLYNENFDTSFEPTLSNKSASIENIFKDAKKIIKNYEFCEGPHSECDCCDCRGEEGCPSYDNEDWTTKFYKVLCKIYEAVDNVKD